MKANVRSIRKKRKYSDDFKRNIVSDFEGGKFSIVQLERLHGISNVLIYKWIYKFSTFNEKGYRVVEVKDSSSKKMKELEARIKELESTIGRKQIKIDYLEKMMDIDKEELDIDIKKNFGTPQSTGSVKKQKVSFSMNDLYKEAGLSKQAVVQYAARQQAFDNKVEQMILEADKRREDHPGCGVEKMYYTLNPDFIGRDRFIELMMEVGYRLKRKRNYRRTTIASKLYYPNLIKGMEVNRPNMIWQSDATYIPIGNKHYYAVFIIDVYTKKIVGYKVSDNMRARANMDALKMALKDNDAPLIHHSDRGYQYTYKEYISLLKKNGSRISMHRTMLMQSALIEQ
ncbi:IS3 family transposase [Flavobacteriaceae bacterium F08102]|nr:IS3 family transposase [Flavobacteriaceae bacterium F08102]